MKNIILFLIAILSIVACSEDTLTTYSDKDSTLNMASVKRKINFAFSQTHVLTDTVVIDVQLVGAIQDMDRTFKIGVVDSLTTAEEGVHFTLKDEYVFPKNAYQGSFELVVLRDTTLKDSLFTLALTVLENEHFTSSMVGISESDTEVIDYQVQLIEVLDFQAEPEWWAHPVFVNYYYGRYHPMKLKLLYDLYEVPEEDRGSWVFNPGAPDVFFANMAILKQFFIDNEYYYEDGSRVTVPYSV